MSESGRRPRWRALTIENADRVAPSGVAALQGDLVVVHG
jgi:hypothetical protein